MARKYNTKAFDEINSVSAYWLGFYFSDGCVFTSKNKYSVILSSTDLEAIEKLKKFYGILDSKTISRTIPESGKKYYSLGIHSKILFNRMVELGCVPNKSLIIEPPKIDKEFIPAFLLGVIDGDGSISLNKSINQWKVSIGTGSEIFAGWVKSEMDSRNLLPSLEVRKNKNAFYNITLFGNSGKIFLDELYRSVPTDLPLSRKYKAYLDMTTSISRRGPNFQDWEVEILLDNSDLEFASKTIKEHPKNYGWVRSVGTLRHKKLSLLRNLDKCITSEDAPIKALREIDEILKKNRGLL